MISWIDNGIRYNKFIMLLVKELEDLALFTVYFDIEAFCQKYKDDIISESKVKVI